MSNLLLAESRDWLVCCRVRGEQSYATARGAAPAQARSSCSYPQVPHFLQRVLETPESNPSRPLESRQWERNRANFGTGC